MHPLQPSNPPLILMERKAPDASYLIQPAQSPLVPQKEGSYRNQASPNQELELPKEVRERVATRLNQFPRMAATTTDEDATSNKELLAPQH